MEQLEQQLCGNGDLGSATGISEDDNPQHEVRLADDADPRGENGIATAEFAIVTLAAVGFAGLLVTILSSGDVRELLMGLVRQALTY